MQFHRDWVAQNRPVIFRGATQHWPAFKKWQNNDYFRGKIGGNRVTVSVTPNGYADAALPIESAGANNETENYQFVMPHEEEISVDRFLNVLEATPETGMSL